MAATTGPALWPGTSTFPGTGVYPGQGGFLFVRCRLAFDDLSVASPSWYEVTYARLRSYSVTRGRDSELAQFSSGTATIVLDNRSRAYDPTNSGSPYYPNVTPMNRVWLYAEFSGEVHDLFRGYVESWDQEWPSGGWSDATVTLNCADGFKLLALVNLPTTSPARNSYEELIGSDLPDGYWRMNTAVATRKQEATDVPVDPRSQGPFLPGRTTGWWPD